MMRSIRFTYGHWSRTGVIQRSTPRASHRHARVSEPEDQHDRVLPGRPGWLALYEARSLAREVLLAPSSASDTRRSGLVRTRAELTPAAGRRRLLVTVDYPRN